MATRKKRPWNAGKVLFPELQTGEPHVVKPTPAKVIATPSTGLMMSPRLDAARTVTVAARSTPKTITVDGAQLAELEAGDRPIVQAWQTDDGLWRVILGAVRN